MEIKFQRSLDTFTHILSFDLAKKTSGYSIITIVGKEIIKTGIITTIGEHPWAAFLNYLNQLLEEIKQLGIDREELLIVKERMPNQAGTKSTIATLQGLAKVHAIFDLWCQEHDLNVYDYDGIHSISVKSFIKSKSGIEKPSKQDIANFLGRKLINQDIQSMDLNITDSIAVAIVLIQQKWNSDLDKEISIIKKEMKKYKTDKKKIELQQRVTKLKNLTKEVEEWEEAPYITQDQ